MPLLARMLPAPVVVDVRAGAVAQMGELLTNLQVARRGRVAVVLGPGQGDGIDKELDVDKADVLRVAGGTFDAAVDLGQRLRSGRFEAVAGVGGGRTIDATKFGAHMAGIPMVAVTTSLGHDGIASPVSTLHHESGAGSYGVVMPVAVIVDLDRVRSAPWLSAAGIGDAISDLSAISDWEIAAHDVGDQIDGLAVALARTAGQAVLHQPGELGSEAFLTVLAESLILSGMAMAVAGSSHPASGSEHEIMHAANHLFPGKASHGELVGVGSLFCALLREDDEQAESFSACLSRHGLPRTPADLGLSQADFAKAVAYAPQTRPGRYTILERLVLSEAQILDRVRSFVKTVDA